MNLNFKGKPDRPFVFTFAVCRLLINLGGNDRVGSLKTLFPLDDERVDLDRIFTSELIKLGHSVVVWC